MFENDVTEEQKRKLVYKAEYYVASHRPHKMFTLDDVNNIAVGFAEKCIEEVTKELQEQIEKMKKDAEWHYVKDELPRKSDSTLCELMPVFVAVKVGYKISTYGTYWNLKLGKFECLDKVYAWCYTPEPPELKESE